MATSETILSNQVHPGDSSVQIVVGDKFKGDGFYGRSEGLHTAQYAVGGFIGTVVMQAALAVSPVEADWFTLPETEHISPSTDDGNANISVVKNFTGNYTWVRATVINWTDGNVSQVLLNH
jgi:hypothetical protein